MDYFGGVAVNLPNLVVVQLDLVDYLDNIPACFIQFL